VHYQPKDIIFPWSPRRLEYLLEDIGPSSRPGKNTLLWTWRVGLGAARWQSDEDRETIVRKWVFQRFNGVRNQHENCAVSQQEETSSTA
jgi:hypothetical protein